MERYKEDAPLEPRMKNIFSTHILKTKILKSLEKPLNLHNYNAIRDPNEHVKHVDDLMDYDNSNENVKWNIFTP